MLKMVVGCLIKLSGNEELKKPNLNGKINYIDEMSNAEKARITSEFNTNLTNKKRKKKIIDLMIINLLEGI